MADGTTFPPPPRPPATEALSLARAVSAALLVLFCAIPAAAQHPRWRLFTSDDGLAETWVYYISRGPSGRIWASHGIHDISVFDGYRVARVPSAAGQLYPSEDPGGTLWSALPAPDTVTCGGLRRLVGNRWVEFPVREAAGTPLNSTRVHAWAANRALLLTPRAVIEVNANDGSSQVLVDAATAGIGGLSDLGAARDGGVWIAGERGLMKLSAPNASTPSRLAVQLPGSFRQAVRPVDHPRGLLVTTRTSSDGFGALLQYANGRWTTLADSRPDGVIAAGWLGEDDSVWIVRGIPSQFEAGILNAFTVSVRRDGGPESTLPRMRALSGIFYDVEPDPDGGFWLGTSLGLVRYLPAAWRRPPGIGSRQAHTGPVLEVAPDEIVAIEERAVLHRTKSGWREIVAPPAFPLNINHPDSAGALPGRRVAVGTHGISGRVPPLIFDLDRGTFEPLLHPEGRWVEVVGRRRAGGVWTMTRGAADVPARIESYDGQRFEVRQMLDGEWEGLNRPRHIVDVGSGDLIVVPTPHGIGRLHGTTFEWLMPLSGALDSQPFTALQLENGTIWYGGRDGVSTIDNGGMKIVRGGLQTVRRLLQGRNGDVWAASNSGVHRFTNGSWITMTDDEGLPEAAAYYVLEDSRGRMWVSTTAGLSVQHPEADREPPDTMMAEGQNPTDAPPSGEIRFVYEAIDRWHHTPSARLLFSYQIDGGEWSPFSGETGTVLTDLRAGPHEFAVRAMDRNGNVDASPATLTFSVLLPWYKEPSVLGLVAIASLALVAAVGLFVTRQFRLERLVQARTEQLRGELEERQRIEQERARLEEQLVQSQKMDALGRLAGGVSHDFNNLLTVITSYGELLAEELEPSDERRQHADEIVNAANRATALTQQLLSFSRHQGVQRQVVDLNAILTELMRMLTRLLGERIELTFDAGEQLWPLLADRGQIEQIVVNLAVNARDAMPDGGRLTLETSNVDLDAAYVREHVDAHQGPHVRLSIADTGTGMDEATRARIFEPFFTTKGPGKGSGLGLATVYGIVRQTDGHIVVDTAPGRGTRFDVMLPRSFARPAAASEPAHVAAGRGTETILLVEDEQAVRDLTTRILERLGYRVVQARNADEAMQHVEKGLAPDLLVTDVVMPGLGGRQLAERMRARFPTLPVLLMSGYTTDTAVHDPGKDMDFLQKPFTPAALGEAVRALLSRTS